MDEADLLFLRPLGATRNRYNRRSPPHFRGIPAFRELTRTDFEISINAGCAVQEVREGERPRHFGPSVSPLGCSDEPCFPPARAAGRRRPAGRPAGLGGDPAERADAGETARLGVGRREGEPQRPGPRRILEGPRRPDRGRNRPDRLRTRQGRPRPAGLVLQDAPRPGRRGAPPGRKKICERSSATRSGNTTGDCSPRKTPGCSTS